MIISRTPFRLSFFGGGTDYKDWFERYGGAVLGTTINKYCYITFRQLPELFERVNRVVYSKSEYTSTFNEIQHPGVRETLRYLNLPECIEIHHVGDLPARSGIGTSSSFVVGLLNTCYASLNKEVTQRQLALEAYHIEYERSKEVVGYQDQVFAAYGGFRHIKFYGSDFEVSTTNFKQHRIDELYKHLLLVYVGGKRDSSPIAASYIKNNTKYKSETKRTYEIVNEAIDIIQSEQDITELGDLLHETWLLKRRRGEGVTTHKIDELYDIAQREGAIGGKIIGAGGAGFMLLFVRPENQHKVKLATHLLGCVNIQFSFESSGSKIVFDSKDS